MRRKIGAALIGLFCAIAGCTQAAPDDMARDQLRQIPMRDDDGTTIMLSARVCRPAGDGAARVVIINHGSPASAAARPGMVLRGCGDEASRWFLSRGYIVVHTLRRGYGDTGGNRAESYGRCAQADYYDAGPESARGIDAIVTYATALPFARHDGAVVVGQSAGGRGGHRHGVPGDNCQPERLAAAAGRYGSTSQTPMLWIYAQNDSYFAPPIAVAMHDAFTASSGHATSVRPASYGDDGHHLFFGDGGSAIWGPTVQHYLDSRKAGPT